MASVVRIPFRVPPRSARAFDVVGFGLNSADLIAVLAEHPAAGTKQRLQRFARLPGGQMAGAMATCARLGLRARYVGTFGDDELGRLSRDSLAADGVDLSAAPTIPGALNPFAVVLVDARSGERTMVWDRPSTPAAEASQVSREAVTSGRLLMVDCHETAAAAQAVRFARDAAIPTVAHIEKVRPGIGELLQGVDVVMAARDFPPAFTGHEELGRAIEAIGRDYRVRSVCVTLGAQGSLAWCGGREIRTPAFPVDCVDSTGAGDAFRGAFAAACLHAPDGDLEDAFAYASAVAALNCRALGARGGLPTAAEVDQLMLTFPRM
jgi:sulfofructose kinase